MRELELIRHIQAGAATRNPAVRLGIGDDCAILDLRPGEQMLVTTDLCLEGRHFRRDWHTPASAGHRCLARGLSDIAAMGGRPIAAFLSLALPAGFDPAWVEGFLAGFHALAARFSVQLAGGDTAQAPGPHIAADIVVLGAARAGHAFLRTGAAPGDSIYVTGTLGGAALELQQMAAGAPPRNPAIEPCPQTFPEPRVAISLDLQRRTSTSMKTDQALGLVTACIDLSDGLSTDLWHLCEASGVGAEIQQDDLPIAPGASLQQALAGGEDYELLFTARRWPPQLDEIAGVKITRIGSILPPHHGIRILQLDSSSIPLERSGWEHFRSETDPRTNP